MLFQSWTTHRSVSARGGEHALNKLLSVCWCLHMQRQIDAERKRQQVKKVASAKLEKLLTKKAEVRHLLSALSSCSFPHTLPLLHPPPLTPSHCFTLLPSHLPTAPPSSPHTLPLLHPPPLTPSPSHPPPHTLLPSHPPTTSPPPPLTFLQLQRNKNELEGTMRKVFSSVFVHRYRDVRPEIRALCIAELGSWMMEYRYAE